MLTLGIIYSLPYFPALFRLVREKNLLGKDKEIFLETGFIWSMVMFSVISPGIALKQADYKERLLELKAPHAGCSWRQWSCTWLKNCKVSIVQAGSNGEKKTAWARKKLILGKAQCSSSLCLECFTCLSYGLWVAPGDSQFPICQDFGCPVWKHHYWMYFPLWLIRSSKSSSKCTLHIVSNFFGLCAVQIACYIVTM